MTKKPPTIAAAVGVASPRVGAAVRKRAVDEAVASLEREGVRLDSPEAGKRIERVVRGSRAEAKRHLETGSKIHWRQHKGGRSRNANDGRNRKLAVEFLQRCERTGLSATALKAEIGQAHGLGRRASINAIDRGLKILCSLAAKVHK